MQRTSFEQWDCPIARTLDVVGEWWTPLVVRDLAVGVSRFDALQGNLGVSRKVLTQRLAKLREHGVVERIPYQDNPVRYDYRLTEKGAELAMILGAMQTWGVRWMLGDTPPPVVMRHNSCGAITQPVVACSECGEPLRLADLTPLFGEQAGRELASPAMPLLSGMMRSAAITGRTDTLGAWCAGRQGGRWAQQTVEAAFPTARHAQRVPPAGPEPARADPAETLRELTELHQGGVVSDTEFEALRARMGV